MIPRIRGRSSTLTSELLADRAAFYGYDAHRNIGFLTDTTGNVTDTYTYDAWGNVVARTGTTSNTRLYSGEEFNPDLGLINLRAREYNAGTGRFLTSDPHIGNFAVPLSFNRYLYTTKDPVNHLDPSGRTNSWKRWAFSSRVPRSSTPPF